MALVATAGASNANSYATLNQAESYMENRLHSDNWDDSNDTDREAALIWATQLLDRLCNWEGSIASETQALRWPRFYVYDPDGNSVDETTIPQFLIEATAEFALFLIGSDLTITYDRSTAPYKQLEAGPLNVVFNTGSNTEIVKDSIMPVSVWVIVRPYCSRIGAKKMLIRV